MTEQTETRTMEAPKVVVSRDGRFTPTKWIPPSPTSPSYSTFCGWSYGPNESTERKQEMARHFRVLSDPDAKMHRDITEEINSMKDRIAELEMELKDLGTVAWGDGSPFTPELQDLVLATYPSNVPLKGEG